MSVAEIIASGSGLFSQSKQYADAGITLVENTAEEIRDAALEMLSYWEAPFSREREFWKMYPRSKSPHTGVDLHGEIRLRIGSKFLEGYSQ
jgi:tRNA-dihydrouridine synthase